MKWPINLVNVFLFACIPVHQASSSPAGFFLVSSRDLLKIFCFVGCVFTSVFCTFHKVVHENSQIIMINTLRKEETLLSLCEDVVLPEQWEHFKTDTFVVQQGGLIKQSYILKTGVLKIGITYHKSDVTIAYLVPGDLIGLTGMFKSLNYPYYIKAVADTDVYVWEMSKIVELIGVMPEIARGVKKNHSIWAGNLIERMKSLVFLAPYQRVAAWVRDYCQNDNYHLRQIWSVLSYAEMAGYCNVGKESFLMHLEELQKNGVIQYSESDCNILNWEKLNLILS